jgi:alkylhydroperoxidase AhpD family core domain
MSERVKRFNDYRRRMNERILAVEHQVVRRFFALDHQTYAKDSALDRRTKELLGLVASLVLRCDDCVAYHIGQCRALGIDAEQIFDAMSVGLVVGGSIVIPHFRRAVEYLDALDEGAATDSPAKE